MVRDSSGTSGNDDDEGKKVATGGDVEIPPSVLRQGLREANSAR